MTVSAIDEQLDSASMCSQLPAFATADRAMIDVLAVTREGRLAVVELKADEDIHLPLQGLDYWARVQWHHSYSLWRSRCIFIPLRTPCCAISHPRSTGH